MGHWPDPVLLMFIWQIRGAEFGATSAQTLSLGKGRGQPVPCLPSSGPRSILQYLQTLPHLPILVQPCCITGCHPRMQQLIRELGEEVVSPKGLMMQPDYPKAAAS